jgi:hypothetical protein
MNDPDQVIGECNDGRDGTESLSYGDESANALSHSRSSGAIQGDNGPYDRDRTARSNFGTENDAMREQ